MISLLLEEAKTKDPSRSRKTIVDDHARPVGWIQRFPTSAGLKFELWLQNYAAYHSPDFILEFDTEKQALDRACKIMSEWRSKCDTPYPTWIA